MAETVSAKQSNEGRCSRQRSVFRERTMTNDQMKIESVRLAIAIHSQGTSPTVILETAAAIFAFIAGDRKGP